MGIFVSTTHTNTSSKIRSCEHLSRSDSNYRQFSQFPWQQRCFPGSVWFLMPWSLRLASAESLRVFEMLVLSITVYGRDITDVCTGVTFCAWHQMLPRKQELEGIHVRSSRKTSVRLLFCWILLWKHKFLSSILSNAACVTPFVVFINQSNANVCKNESPISVHPPLLFGNHHVFCTPTVPCCPQRAGERGKSFLIMPVMLNYWDFGRILVVQTAAERQHWDTSVLIRMLQSTHAHTHAHTTQRTNLTLWDFSERWRLASDRTAAGHPKLL